MSQNVEGEWIFRKDAPITVQHIEKGRGRRGHCRKWNQQFPHWMLKGEEASSAVGL